MNTENLMFEIVCQVLTASNYAYDIHYGAEGKLFYQDHIFSERVGNSDKSYNIKDDILETFFLGRGLDAPLSEDINSRIVEITPEVSGDEQENFRRLRDLIVECLTNIELLSDLTRGEEDLIGKIAHWLQRNNGLLYRQVEYLPE